MLILVGHLGLISTMFIRNITDALMSSIIQRYLIMSMGGVFITFFVYVKNGSFIIVINRIGVLVKSWLIGVLRNVNWGAISLMMRNIENCIGMNSMMKRCNLLMYSMMDRYCMYNWSNIVMYNWSNFMMDHWSYFVMNNWSMVNSTTYSMMRSRNTMDTMETMDTVSSMKSNWSSNNLMNKMTW